MEKSKNVYITNPIDIYIFFEIIKQVEPDSILDIGMFLKRIGAVSRQVKDARIAEEIILDALDYEECNSIKVCETIYNTIFNEFPEKKYDLTIALGLSDVFPKDVVISFLVKANICSKYMFLDEKTFSIIKSTVGNKKSKPINVDNKNYYLIFM